VTNEIWKNDNNKERNTIKIILNIELEPTQTQTQTPTAITTAAIDLRLRVNHQPAISLRRLLKLKHNQSIESNDFNFNNPKSRE
jgi:hypothetical protein